MLMGYQCGVQQQAELHVMLQATATQLLTVSAPAADCLACKANATDLHFNQPDNVCMRWAVLDILALPTDIAPTADLTA